VDLYSTYHLRKTSNVLWLDVVLAHFVLIDMLLLPVKC